MLEDDTQLSVLIMQSEIWQFHPNHPGLNVKTLICQRGWQFIEFYTLV